MIHARRTFVFVNEERLLTCSLRFNHHHFAWLASAGLVERVQVELILRAAANLVYHVNVRVRHLFAGPFAFVAAIVDYVACRGKVSASFR